MYVKWKSFFKDKNEKPQIEVKCDRKAEDLRFTAKKLFSSALGVEVKYHFQGILSLSCLKYLIL